MSRLNFSCCRFDTHSVADLLCSRVVSFDVLPDKIYQVARISYKVKGDPAKETFIVPGLAVFHKKPEDTKIHRFDVYIDISPVFKRIQEVAASRDTKD